LRRLVSVLCVLALTACGGGAARTALPPAGSAAASSGAAAVPPGTGAAAGRASGILLSTQSIKFTATGWDATQVVKTTWTDDSRKTAVTSDPLVATVSPPYQLAAWTAPNAYGAQYWITPVGAGTATITFSDHDGAESAQLSVSVVALPTGTLYVAGAGEVDAFPAAANGSMVPDRRITGFYHEATPPSYHDGGGVGAIGTAADGTLYILRNFQSGVMSFDCSAYPVSASGVRSTVGFDCGARGYGAAAGPAGEIDVLFGGYTGRATVQRFVSDRLTSSLTVPASGVGLAFGGLATGSNGNLFVSTNTSGTAMPFSGQVLEYAAGAADGAAPIRTIAAPAGDYFEALAVAADGTLYAALDVPNDATGHGTYSIDAFAPGATSPSRTLGPFGTDSIAGLACDRGGELYVAFNPNVAGAQARIDVYAPGATGNAVPVRTIPNPIPSNAAGGQGIAGISLGPPQPLPPEQVLSRRRRP
jgi:hypothetical protein